MHLSPKALLVTQATLELDKHDLTARVNITIDKVWDEHNVCLCLQPSDRLRQTTRIELNS